MSLALPDSARAAWWLTAWLRGAIVTDLVLDELFGDGLDTVVVGLDGTPKAHTLLDLMLELRRRGATEVGLALPVAGDPIGLGGPAAFNASALENGEAAISVSAGVGMVPTELPPDRYWHVHPAHRRQVPDVGEADRGLRAALLESATQLAQLDVARWRPEAADELMELRRPIDLAAPPSTPSRCVELAGRALRAWTITDLVTADDGGAVSSWAIAARRDVIEPLGRAARRALVAACSPECWPG